MLTFKSIKEKYDINLTMMLSYIADENLKFTSIETRKNVRKFIINEVDFDNLRNALKFRVTDPTGLPDKPKIVLEFNKGINKWAQNINLFFKYFNIECFFSEIFNADISKLNFNAQSKILFNYCFNITNVICTKCLERERKYTNFSVGYVDSCCNLKCINKMISIRMTGDKNSYHKMTEKTRLAAYKKQSITMKNKIKNGEFTPPITNSWANSRVKIKIENCNYLFRSTWEAMFWMINQHLEYEKIRIPYIINKENHNYIVDFCDFSKKILYEIKPLRNIHIRKNTQKEKYAKKWCKLNGYTYNIISEDHLLENIESIKEKLVLHPNMKIEKSVKRLLLLKRNL